MLADSAKPRLSNGLYFEDTNGVVYYYGTPTSYNASRLISNLSAAGISDPYYELCLVIVSDNFCARVSAPVFVKPSNRADYPNYNLPVYRNMKSGYEVRDLVIYSNPTIGKDYYVTDFCYTYTFPSGAGDGYLPCYEEVFYLLNTCKTALNNIWGKLFDGGLFGYSLFPTVSYYNRSDDRIAAAYNTTNNNREVYYVRNETNMHFKVFGFFDPTKYKDAVY